MSPARHKLTKYFAAFFKRVNPSPTYEEIAARAHSEIKGLIEDKDGPAGDLQIRCFLQGSYRRETAIHTINDVDLVAHCRLSHTSSANQNTRDQIFRAVADAILANNRYKDKVKYRKRSICIKVMLEGIKVEVLPTIRVQGKAYEYEPFYMFQPEENENIDGFWRKGFARYHQSLCTEKNASTSGLFVPMIKVFKHLRFVESTVSENEAVSFHIECLLYILKNSIYSGAPCECIEAVLKAVAGFTPDKAEHSGIRSPCRDKKLFDPNEWTITSYREFNQAAAKWYGIAAYANDQNDKEEAIRAWKELLGDSYFPRDPK
ncbi:MAG: nucleotidyltransferase [Desulfobacterales bacterium]|nr:nucleotidyltransferase [Desulfobacterales bacterium]